MAVYTYDSQADAPYVLLVDQPEAAIERTEEPGPTLHVDLDARGQVVGVEFLYPRTHGIEAAWIDFAKHARYLACYENSRAAPRADLPVPAAGRAPGSHAARPGA